MAEENDFKATFFITKTQADHIADWWMNTGHGSLNEFIKEQQSGVPGFAEFDREFDTHIQQMMRVKA